ncbi:hypothetical protein GCM10009758_28810 [Microbacterium hatanonis]
MTIESTTERLERVGEVRANDRGDRPARRPVEADGRAGVVAVVIAPPDGSRAAARHKR